MRPCVMVDSSHGNSAKELEIYVRYGMTEMQAIEAATRVNAEIMGLDDRLGNARGVDPPFDDVPDDAHRPGVRALPVSDPNAFTSSYSRR